MTLTDLLDIVGASGPDSQDRGPVVVRTTIWDGRLVSAAYYKDGPKRNSPDVETRGDVFWDTTSLEPFVDRLLDTGESFVTMTGSHDDICVLEWSISSSITATTA